VFTMPAPTNLLILFPLVLCLAVGVLLWIFALVDCLRNEPSEGNEKLLWTLVIVFTSFLGAVVYLVLRRPKRIQQCGGKPA
jgi:hypothetical protein